MVLGDFKNYLFQKFIFPKTLIIDMPGMVAGTLVNILGNRKFKTRILLYFEDLLVELYRETKNELGEKESDLLWYKIGKDVSTRYFSFYQKEKVPKYLIKPILDHVFNFLPMSGMSFAKNIDKTSNENFFSVSGKDSLVVRKTGSPALCLGILSGILSFVHNKNIEAHCKKLDSEGIALIASKNFKEIYVPEKELLKFEKNYFNLNFKTISKFSGLKKHPSLLDMIKFKKTYFHKNHNDWMFENLTLFPAEVGLFGIVMENYFKKNLSELFCSSYLRSSELIFKKIIGENKTKKEKINYLSNLFSGLGFGISFISEKGEEVIVKIFNPPISKYGSFDRAIIFNGALNVVYGKKLMLRKSSPSEMIYSQEGIN